MDQSSHIALQQYDAPTSGFHLHRTTEPFTAATVFVRLRRSTGRPRDVHVDDSP